QTASLAIADFNGDGKLDVVAVNNASKTISTLLGNGDGTFAPKIDIASYYPISVAAGDLNRDGKIDIAVATGSGTVTVLLGQGDGTFGPAVGYPVSNNMASVASADLNHDDKLDLIVTNVSANTVSILLGNG